MIFRRNEKIGVSGVVMLIGMAVVAVVIATHADPQTLSISSLREGHGGYLLALAVVAVAIAAAMRSNKESEKK
jgi:hypothetical protein